MLLALLYISDLKAQTLSISSFSPNSGSPGTLLTIQGVFPEDNSINVSIAGKDAMVLSHSTESIVAYVMPGTISGPVKISSASSSASSSGSFMVHTTAFPNAQLGDKLLTSGNTGNAGAGRSVAISADGNTVIIGAPVDNSRQGAAWVYVREGSHWKQQGSKLFGLGAVGAAEQGRSVGISADGNTAIVGGNNDNGGIGAAWIFIRKGGVWTQQGSKLVGTGYDDFILPVNMGYAVSMSADGNTVILGAPYDNYPRGAAWIFSRSDGLWTQQGEKLFEESSISGGQGISVGLSADGNTAILGAPLENNQEGAAYLFFKSGTEWNRQAKKLNTTGSSGTKWQGISVALSADGSSAIVGASVAENARGAAWVFEKNGAEWLQKGNQIFGRGSSDNAGQGWSVAMSADGNTLLLGSYADNWTTGAAWVFTWSNNNWIQRGPKLTGVGNIGMANQAQSLALSADGSTAILGANLDNEGMGAGWVFGAGPSISIFLKSYTSIFCKGLISTEFFYEETEGNPDVYSIIWDKNALEAGLVNVIDQELPKKSFNVNMPASLKDGIYNGALKVKNKNTGESSTGTIFTLAILEPPHVSPITGSSTVAVGSEINLTSLNSSLGEWKSNLTSIATVDPVSGLVKGISEGTSTITYTATNAEGCSNSSSFDILVLPASSRDIFSFPDLPEMTYGDSEFIPKVYDSGGNTTIVFSSSNPKVALVNEEGKIVIRGVGTTLITASVAGNAANNASKLLTVKPKLLTIKAKDQSRVYGLDNPPFMAEYIGFVQGEDASVLENQVFLSTSAKPDSAPGSYPIIAEGAIAKNYDINFQNGTLQISKAEQLLIFESIPNKTMAEESFGLVASVNSGLPISFNSSDTQLALIVNGNQVKLLNPGKVKITAMQEGNVNYNSVSSFQEFIIYPVFFKIGTNSFTPNGDGINDRWELPGLEADKTVFVRVYSRYGKLVFQSRGYSNSWDGSFRGAKLPQGVYYYKISVQSGKQVLSGVLNIIY